MSCYVRKTTLLFVLCIRTPTEFLVCLILVCTVMRIMDRPDCQIITEMLLEYDNKTCYFRQNKCSSWTR